MPVNQRGQSWQAAVSYKGKRMRKDFPTKEEALAWEASTLADLRSGRVEARPAVKVPTLREHLDRVHTLRWRGSKGEQTAMINATHVIEVLGPNRLVNTLSKEDVLTIKQTFTARGISDATINRKLAAFSVLVKEAVEFGYLAQPFKAGITKERQGRVRYLTTTEEAFLISWAKQMHEPEFLAYLIVSIDTGFRQGEVLKITKEDVGKANLWTYDTKNGKSREVPLTKRAREQLQILADKCRGPRDKVFTLKPAAIRERWRKAQTKLDLIDDEDFVPHIMRHTFVTRLLESGVDIKTVQELAGHENITTTQRYAHSSPERKKLAIQRMAGYQAA